MKNMKSAKIITWIGLIAMIAGLINGFVRGDFAKDGKKLLSNPWGVMSLVDLYVGFSLFSMWIFYREKHMGKSIIWTILMMTFGFLTACVYILVALYDSKGDWNRFFKGKTL